MFGTRKRFLFIGVVLALTAGLSTASFGVISTFDTDLDGWTIIGDASTSHVATGGNPGGYMRIDDGTPETGYTYAIAPTKFLGDQSAANGQMLSFDAIVLSRDGVDLSGFASIKLSSSTDSTVWLDLGGPEPSWALYDILLDAVWWGKTETQWLALLSDLTEIRINIEAINGAEAVGFDNFVFVPEPATLGLLLLGGLGVLIRRGSQGMRRTLAERRQQK